MRPVLFPVLVTEPHGRQRTAVKVAAIRTTIPLRHKAPLYSPATPKAKKMSMKFN